MNAQHQAAAPGARILVRDAEWLVRRVDRTSTGGDALTVVGVSELVRGKEAMFLTEVEKSIEMLDPADTRLVPDTSTEYQASMLYMESLLRQTPPTDDNLYIGHKAAMDPVPFQLDPAIQALEQPRQRILIADAVGLGKTLECGVLLSELIRRGKGKRILVVAVKSMLTQFQKELWSRFTIPLIRLDSIGIQRIRARIPTNHNPFYYYDKSIISIDTLKQDAEYRTYLENAYWDIIVIDEAHNVAERGTTSSLRSKLARLLSQRSDTLIMLSATPHDGKATSFASLMNMLDPTAIADPANYGPDDIKGLFIRRFKKDIQEQVERAFKERTIQVARCKASPAEERAHDVLADMTLKRLNYRDSSGKLYKTTLEKSLFSSPAACLQTINTRLRRLEKLEDSEYDKDIASLRELRDAVTAIGPKEFTRYRQLVELVADPNQGICWDPADPQDRLVIFTERIETLKFLQKHLKTDMNLKDNQLEILHGGMSDVDQQRIVEDFGKDEEPVRLLIASDVASEGINLHFLCHRMIHFDIPWSLMVFQQRNGRIDRYGQERTPEILYLRTDSDNEKIQGDARILDVLIKKDQQAVENIGDPSALMGVYDIDKEEEITAEAMERDLSPEEFEKSIDEAQFDLLDFLVKSQELRTGEDAQSKTGNLISLFRNDFDFLTAGLRHLQRNTPLQIDVHPQERRIDLVAPDELKERFRYFASEMWPEDGHFTLSERREDIQKEIERSRKDEKAWPAIQYLWPLHPVMEWLNDKVIASFGRHEAPVITLRDVLAGDEVVFIMSGLIPNRKSHPVLHDWFGVVFKNGRLHDVEDLAAVMKRTGLGTRAFPNPCDDSDPAVLRLLLPAAVEEARRIMKDRSEEYRSGMYGKLNEHLDRLSALRQRQYAEISRRAANSRTGEKAVQAEKEREQRAVDRIFDEYVDWVTETMEIEAEAYVRVAAVLKGKD